MMHEQKMNKNVVLHENVFMPNEDLPISFIEHYHNSTGPFCVMHWHDEIELVYIAQGVISSTCNANTITAEVGDFIFVNSNEFHDYTVLQAPISLYCTVIDLSLLQGRYLNSYDSQFISSAQKFTIFENHIANDEMIKAFFMSMWDENQRKEIGYEYAIKSNLYGIFSSLVRSYTKSTMTNRENTHKTKNVKKINKVIKYIESNYQKDIKLDELADLLNFNRYYFCRFFKETTGVTPMQYINDYRIHQAISMMTNSPELSITEIAMNCGYNDSNYFARVFRNVTGLTPSNYRVDLEKANNAS